MPKNHHKNTQLEMIDSMLTTMLNLEAEIEQQAEELRQSFYDSRTELQNLAQESENGSATIHSKSARRIFCPLNLSVRMLRGTLQIYWHTLSVNRVTKKKQYKYITMNRSGQYDMRTLNSKAMDFEVDLVRETEAQATNIRLRWKKLNDARRHLIRLKEVSK